VHFLTRCTESLANWRSGWMRTSLNPSCCPILKFVLLRLLFVTVIFLLIEVKSRSKGLWIRNMRVIVSINKEGRFRTGVGRWSSSSALSQVPTADGRSPIRPAASHCLPSLRLHHQSHGKLLRSPDNYCCQRTYLITKPTLLLLLALKVLAWRWALAWMRNEGGWRGSVCFRSYLHPLFPLQQRKTYRRNI
jgi:hypothetical protein